MAAKFTPGPLTVGRTFPSIYDASGREIAHAYRWDISDLDDRDRAFTVARFLAAAPELADLLKRALHFVRLNNECLGACDHSVGICNCDGILLEEQARALLARIDADTSDADTRPCDTEAV